MAPKKREAPVTDSAPSKKSRIGRTPRNERTTAESQATADIQVDGATKKRAQPSEKSTAEAASGTLKRRPRNTRNADEAQSKATTKVSAPEKSLAPTTNEASKPRRRGEVSEPTKSQTTTSATKARKSKSKTGPSLHKSVADVDSETKPREPTNDQDDENPKGSDAQYWLMKAEPESRIEKGRDVKFSIDDLASRTKPEGWDGVRNPMARNNMRAMKKGDLAFFYHSNCSVPGIAGVMRIVAEHSVDESAFDPEHPYYDPKSTREKPKWELVHVEFVKKFDNLVTLKDLKSFSQPNGKLENMQTLKQSRLSVSRVSASEWDFIMSLAKS